MPCYKYTELKTKKKKKLLTTFILFEDLPTDDSAGIFKQNFWSWLLD